MVEKGLGGRGYAFKPPLGLVLAAVPFASVTVAVVLGTAQAAQDAKAAQAAKEQSTGSSTSSEPARAACAACAARAARAACPAAAAAAAAAAVAAGVASHRIAALRQKCIMTARARAMFLLIFAGVFKGKSAC